MPALPAFWLLLGAVAAPAEPEAILRCEAASKGVHVTFDLTAKGRAQMTVATSGGALTCPLKLRSLYDRPKADKPEVGLDVTLDPEACKPALPDSVQPLTEIVLRFALRGERNLPLGRATWLKDGGPIDCAVSAWDHAAVEVMAEKASTRGSRSAQK